MSKKVVVVALMVEPDPNCPIHGKNADRGTKDKIKSAVATDAYREGWDRVFGTKPTVGKA